MASLAKSQAGRVWIVEMTGSPRSGTRATRWVVIGSITVAVILLTASIVQVEIEYRVAGSRNVAKPAGTFGPRVLVSSMAESPAVAENTTILVQIFGLVPASFGVSSNAPIKSYAISPGDQTSNGIQDELANATISPENSTTTLFLSPSFDTIAAQWRGVLANDGGTTYPSLTVEATKTVSSDGLTSVYLYYNNLQFDPFSLQTLSLNSTDLTAGWSSWFSGSGINPYQYSTISVATEQLNLSLEFQGSPVATLHGAPTADPGGLRTDACGDKDPQCISYYYTYTNTTEDTLLHTGYTWGILPLIGVHVGANANAGGSLVLLGADIDVQSDNISVSSTQPYTSSSGETTTTMSTSPSYTHIANVTAGSSIGEYGATPLGLSESNGNNFSVSQNRTTAFAGIQGVEYAFSHYNQSTDEYQYYWELICDGETGTCQPPKLLHTTVLKSTYDGNFTTGEIYNINSTAGIEVSASWESIWVAWVFQQWLEKDSNGTLDLTASGTDSSYQSSTVWADTYGWTNAAEAYLDAIGALSVYSAALIAGVLISDVAAATAVVTLGASLPAVVAAVATIIFDDYDMSTAILSLFSSIAAFSGSHSVTVTYGFSNYPITGSGSEYSMAFYESQSFVSFTVDGTGYGFYAPEDYLNATGIVA